MAGDPEMGGTYGGDDGPFPPFNDERLHHYNFVVHALDVPSLGLEGSSTSTTSARRSRPRPRQGESSASTR